MEGQVLAVASDPLHRFGKPERDRIVLLAGLGVAGDAHCGATVQHRSRVTRTPAAPNLRQVHLIHAELFDELARAVHLVRPGQLGENVTTRGLELLALSRGTRLRIGAALIELTGLRNPCRQIDDHVGPGAMHAVLETDARGQLVRKAGVMAVGVESGEVRPGDAARVVSVPDLLEPLSPV